MTSTTSPMSSQDELQAQSFQSVPRIPKANALSKLAESESDSDKADVPVRRPNGKLLSALQRDSDESSENDSDAKEAAFEQRRQRLAAFTSISSDEEVEEKADDGEDAYEKMKQRLLASTSLERRLVGGEKTQEASKPVNAAHVSSSEDEDDAPVRANRVRRLQTRRERTASPTVSQSPVTRSRRSSPGLFVTPSPSPAKRVNNARPTEDASSPSAPTHSADFRQRVERIRAERLAKQKEANQKRRKPARQEVEDDDESSNSDGESGRRLTQQAKPTRKAGKKALEAMARDQQRIVRNMQLAHQAKTKKRYGTKDLFAKFGFNQTADNAEVQELPTPDTSSLPATSDAEAAQAQDTPPTSPPAIEDAPEKTGIAMVDAPAIGESNILNKGKGRAPEFQHLPPNRVSRVIPVHRATVETQKPNSEIMVDLDSDSDLEVVESKSRFPVFDKLPERKMQDNSSLLHLRHLAQLTSPGKKGPKGKNSMNMMQLRGSLYQKARQQAQKEREEKLEMLRAKGIVIETEEEKEKRQMEIEDLVAQFEKEKERDLKLAKREREQAKKNGEAGDGLVSSDEDEDEDYVGSGDEAAAAVEGEEGEEEDDLELSGSDDEEADDEEELDDDADETEANAPNALIDTMADEEEDDQSAEKLDDEDEDVDMEDAPVRKPITTRTRKVVVDDEEDEDDSAAQLNGSPTQVATQDDTMAAFGFGMAPPASLGLTQAFAGTMANLEDASQAEPEQDSIDFLRSLPDSQPIADFNRRDDFVVADSQTAASQTDTQNAGVPQMNLGISQLMEEPSTQLSEVPEPTQDAGFLLSRSPAGLAAPFSTVDTVLMPVAESPIAQRKGRLHRRRREASLVLSDIDDENVFSASDAEVEAEAVTSGNVFNVMKKAAKKQKKIDNFNKKTSAAREHLDEQAYESDDEYKGLGGASDDDSGEDDAELAEMIDTTDVKVDERQMAAFFADEAKKADEARIAKIYKDLQSGAFRKRGAGDAFDMSDSEDEVEMRRRKKQREFDQMYRALKQDDVIGKMAENPKRKAFFDTLIDRSDEEDLEFLDHPEEEPTNSASQSDEEKQQQQEETQDISIPDSQVAADTTTTTTTLTTTTTNVLIRKPPNGDPQGKENRPPARFRRTAAADALTRRPITVADIKDSVAELLDDPREYVPDSQYLSESDDNEDDAPATMQKQRVVTNRLSRTSSSSTTGSAAGSMAWSAGSASGFRVPSLVRRATSNLSTASSAERGVSTSGARATTTEGAVRRGGTGRSNVHAQAREAERRAVLEKKEGKRVEAMKKKVGAARGARSVLSGLGGGWE